MNPGHENCASETENVCVIGGGVFRTYRHCLHEHQVEVQTSDPLDPQTVGELCECCGEFLPRREWE